MSTGIRQVVFENGEDMSAVNESLCATGLKLVQVIDFDGIEVFPVDRRNEPKNFSEPTEVGPGGFTLKSIYLDFDLVIIMYLHPASPEIDCIYYAKTEHNRT